LSWGFSCFNMAGKIISDTGFVRTDRDQGTVDNGPTFRERFRNPLDTRRIEAFGAGK